MTMARIDFLRGFEDCPSAVIIPVELMPAFMEMVRRGMAFEHGQPKELYDFADILLAKNDPSWSGPSGVEI